MTALDVLGVFASDRRGPRRIDARPRGHPGLGLPGSAPGARKC